MGKWKELMIRGMEVKGLSKSTVYNYILEMRKLAAYYSKSPTQLDLEDLIIFQHHRVKTEVSKARFKMSVAAMRWFFTHTFPRDWNIEKLVYKKEPKRLPVVFSRQEMIKILDLCENLKQKAIIMFSYSCGLRLTEILNLEIRDIDSNRMLVHVRGGKGGKDRYTPLSKQQLNHLKDYYRQDFRKIKDFLFPGKSGRMDRSSANTYFRKHLRKIGIRKPGTFHTLRHTFATHLLEDGVNILVIQKLLGHSCIKTTMIYLHIATNYVRTSHSPLDTLYAKRSTDDDKE